VILRFWPRGSQRASFGIACGRYVPEWAYSITSDSGSVEVLSFDGSKRKTLVRNGAYGRFLPTGHLVYVNQGTLYAQAFDPNALEVRGTPVPSSVTLLTRPLSVSRSSTFPELGPSSTAARREITCCLIG
jgi:hypothetical protein